jgi:hypothetical protein
MSLIWTQASLEPKRKFRYLVDIAGDANDADFTEAIKNVRFLAQTCDRPGVKVGASEHKYFDKTYYHPGRVTWDPNPISIKLVDIQAKESSGVDTNATLLQAFAKSGLQIFTADNQFRTIGKSRAVGALGSVKIQVLSSLTDSTGFIAGEPALANGGVAEQWILKNAWLESFKPDALDYGSEDILTVTIQVRYDYCEFISPGGAFGQPTES